MLAVLICFMTLVYVICRRITDDGFMSRKLGRNWSSFILKQYFGVSLAELENNVRPVDYQGKNLLLFFNLRTAAFKAYCAIWVRRSNFCHQASPRVSPHESTQRRKVELWARNVRKISPKCRLTRYIYGTFYMP